MRPSLNLLVCGIPVISQNSFGLDAIIISPCLFGAAKFRNTSVEQFSPSRAGLIDPKKYVSLSIIVSIFRYEKESTQKIAASR